MQNSPAGLFFILLLPATGLAQQAVSGKVRLLRIAARAGDTLVVSSAGTLTDTLVVSQDMIAMAAGDGYTIFLHEKVVMAPVSVLAPLVVIPRPRSANAS